MERVRMALIGAGVLGRERHLPNLMTLDSIRLTAVCDPSEAARGIVVRDFAPRGPVFADHRRALEDPETEAVLIVTKQDLHVPLTLEALAAGKHVYVEKPLGETAEECRLVVEAQTRAERIVAVGMNRRMAPAYRKAKELLLANGGARNIQYRIADEYAWQSPFKTKTSIPGRRVFFELCHVFDIIRWLADSEVESAYCISGRHDDEQICLKMRSGATAGIMSSGYTWADMPKEHLAVIAEKGALTGEDFVTLRQFSLSDTEPPVMNFKGNDDDRPGYSPLYLELCREVGEEAMYACRRVIARLEHQVANGIDPERAKEYFHRCVNHDVDKGWKAALDDFARAVREKRRFRGADVVDGYKAALITEAVYESMRTGAAVAVPDPKDAPALPPEPMA